LDRAEEEEEEEEENKNVTSTGHESKYWSRIKNTGHAKSKGVIVVAGRSGRSRTSSRKWKLNTTVWRQALRGERAARGFCVSGGNFGRLLSVA
jgi:hypothetical protein